MGICEIVFPAVIMCLSPESGSRPTSLECIAAGERVLCVDIETDIGCYQETAIEFSWGEGKDSELIGVLNKECPFYEKNSDLLPSVDR